MGHLARAGCPEYREHGVQLADVQRRRRARHHTDDRASRQSRAPAHRQPRDGSSSHRPAWPPVLRSEEHTSELQSHSDLVCRLLLEKKKSYSEIGSYRVLDVGCGEKPYEPLFAPFATSYVGVDPVENPHADVRGSVEALPSDDAGFH